MIRFQHSIVRSARGGLTLAFALAVGMGGQAMGQAQMGTAFTYQGQLKQAGEPMNDVCDFRFSLWDDGGEQIGTTQFTSDVSVEGGLFTALLDFDSGVFDGDLRLLEIAVRCPAGSGDFTTLSPRQELTPAPYSLFSDAADYSDNTRGITVDDQGRVGIGTDPVQGLTLRDPAGTGDVGITQNQVGGPNTMELTTEDSVGSLATRLLLRGGQDQADIEFHRGARGAEQISMIIDGATGNVGIGPGMTNPTDTLDVAGDIHASGTIRSGNSIVIDGVADTITATSGMITFPNTSLAVDGTGSFELDNASGEAISAVAGAGTGSSYGVHGRNDSIRGTGVLGEATAATGITTGVWGKSASLDGKGVYGLATSETGPTHGVFGWSFSTNGTGVLGATDSATGITYGGYFTSSSAVGTGAYGIATAESGDNYGGYFTSNSTAGTGVRGIAQARTGTTYGGRFTSASIDGTAVHAVVSNTSGRTYGGYFKAWSDEAKAVYGQVERGSGSTYGGYFTVNSVDGTGVYGEASAETGTTFGVHGKTKSTEADAAGVFGKATKTSGKTYGVFGETNSSSDDAAGVYGKTSSGQTYGVFGETNSGSIGAAGVFGESTSTSNVSYGVIGKAQTGVIGYGTAPGTGFSYGVIGKTDSTQTRGHGVYGYAEATEGITIGVYGRTNSPDGYGVYSAGNAHVSGELELNGDLNVLKPGTSSYVKPIEFKMFGPPEIGDDVDFSTGYPISQWNVFIGSFGAWNGDINENGAGDIIRCYTYKRNGMWRIRADFRTHQDDHEEWRVGIIAISTRLSNIADNSWFNCGADCD